MKYYETVGGRNIFWVRSERYVLLKKEKKKKDIVKEILRLSDPVRTPREENI